MTRFPIDLLAPEALGLPGRLLMGPAPDLTDLDAELQSLRQDHGVDRLVCFLEAHELEALGLGDLPSSAEATGISTHLFPIPDGSVPKSPEAMDTLGEGSPGGLERGQYRVPPLLGGSGPNRYRGRRVPSCPGYGRPRGNPSRTPVSARYCRVRRAGGFPGHLRTLAEVMMQTRHS